MLLDIKNVREGMKLKQSIFNDNNIILLGKGTVLTKNMIKQLSIRGIDKIDAAIEGIIEQEQFNDSVVEENHIQTVLRQISFMTELEGKGNYVKEMVLAADKEIPKKVIEMCEWLEARPNIAKMIAALKVFDVLTFEHSYNVALLMLTMTKQLGWNHERQIQAGIAGLLHDIGKLDVPIHIINKKGSLTDEEYSIVKNHTRFGYERLINEDNVAYEIALAALLHHEALDGSGYPLGVNEGKMTELARLLAVVDKYEAITGKRLYRKKMVLPEEALEELYLLAYRKIDGDFVSLLRNTIVFYPVGTIVVLNTGEIGIVESYHKEFHTRPTILVKSTIAGKKYRFPYEIDMRKKLNIKITGIRHEN